MGKHRGGWSAVAPYRLNPKRLDELSTVSNAVLTPELIDDSFWGKSRLFNDYDRENINYRNLPPLKESDKKFRKEWAKRHIDLYSWFNCGAVLDCMVAPSCGQLVYYKPLTLLQIEKARSEYHRNTPKRRKVGSIEIVD